MSGSAAVVVRRTGYPQVDPRAAGLMDTGVVVIPARLAVAEGRAGGPAPARPAGRRPHRPVLGRSIARDARPRARARPRRGAARHGALGHDPRGAEHARGRGPTTARAGPSLRAGEGTPGIPPGWCSATRPRRPGSRCPSPPRLDRLPPGDPGAAPGRGDAWRRARPSGRRRGRPGSGSPPGSRGRAHGSRPRGRGSGRTAGASARRRPVGKGRGAPGLPHGHAGPSGRSPDRSGDRPARVLPRPGRAAHRGARDAGGGSRAPRLLPECARGSARSPRPGAVWSTRPAVSPISGRAASGSCIRCRSSRTRRASCAPHGSPHGSAAGSTRRRGASPPAPPRSTSIRPCPPIDSGRSSSSCWRSRGRPPSCARRVDSVRGTS